MVDKCQTELVSGCRVGLDLSDSGIGAGLQRGVSRITQFLPPLIGLAPSGGLAARAVTHDESAGGRQHGDTDSGLMIRTFAVCG